MNVKRICDIIAQELPDNLKEPFLKSKPRLLRNDHGSQNEYRLLSVLEIEPCVA